MTPPAAEPAIALDTLSFVLRERAGADKADESLALVEPFEVPIPGGVASMAPAWFDLVGDLQLRLVRHTPEHVLTLHASELDALGLDADAALAVALENLHRRHGAPGIRAWHGLQRVVGHHEEADSVWFMDRAFWRARLAEKPQGLVAALPRTDALLFAPLADAAAVDAMRRGVPRLHAEGGDYSLSPMLYLFTEDRWRVFPRVAD
jgi:hypothetical protein